MWSFGGGGFGIDPDGGVIEVGGKLYGTARLGGAYGLGTVFELTPPALGQTGWSESILWSFGGAGDGSHPGAGLIEVGGKLYGTTMDGGANPGLFFVGGGTVFELTPPAPGQIGWSESVVWSFGSGYDGETPWTGLTQVRGKLYGTTSIGGVFGGYFDGGVVFELTPPTPGQTGWSESVVWGFGSAGDGINPEAGVIEVGGKLYGTTQLGGSYDEGTVFVLTPPAPGQTGWSESILWSFGGAGDGNHPEAGLTEMGGKLYGTTEYGGAYGWGVVFELTPSAPGQTGWGESILWSFGGGYDGMRPFAGLTQVRGKLYGTTPLGGALAAYYHGGVVFELTPPAPGQTGWSERVLWGFDEAYDGGEPLAGVIEAGGKLYGTTAFGGADSKSHVGNGTVFELAPPPPGQTAWLERVLWGFPDGNYPVAGLISVDGNLYGTVTGGGATGQGDVFEVTP